MKRYKLNKIAESSNEAFERTCLFVALFAKKQQKFRQKVKPLN
jgi:hypothetical protein